MGAWAWSSGPAPRFGLPVTPSPGLTSGRQGFDHSLPQPPPPLAWASVRVSQQVSLRLPYCVFFPDSQLECCLYRGGQIQTLAAATHCTHSGARAAGGPHTGQRPAPQPPRPRSLCSSSQPPHCSQPLQPQSLRHAPQLSAQLLGGCARPKGTALAPCVSRTRTRGPEGAERSE